MCNINDIQAALQCIQQTCKEFENCAICPLGVDGWRCGLTGESENTYPNHHPRNWKLVDRIKLFKELPNESTDGTK